MNRFRKYSLIGWMGLMLLALPSLSEPLAPVQVSEAYVYVPLGSTKTTKGYLVIKNIGSSPLILTQVKSSIAKKINLISKQSASEKLPVDTPWVLNPNQTLNMKIKNQYLEFTQIVSRISSGDDIQLTLYFNNGSKQIIIAKAKSAYDEKHSD